MGGQTRRSKFCWRTSEGCIGERAGRCRGGWRGVVGEAGAGRGGGTGGAVKRGRGRGMQGETRWMGGKVRDAFGRNWRP